jgi:hypothetical protein
VQSKEPPFQAFDYYRPEQQDSASIKAVLPMLTGPSYADLEIQEGGQASLEYLRVRSRYQRIHLSRQGWSAFVVIANRYQRRHFDRRQPASVLDRGQVAVDNKLTV